MREPAPDPRDLALGAAVVGARAAARAARLAFLPLRVAARVPVVGAPLRRMAGGLAEDGRTARVRGREELESATAAIVAAPEVERVVDGALGSPLTDAVAHSLAEHRVVERVAAQVLADAELERAIRAGLEHDTAERLATDVLESRLVERVLASPELGRAIEQIASSPEIRSALGNQTQALVEDVGTSIRGGAARLDERAEDRARRLVRRPHAPEATASYGGAATRAAALAVDFAITHGIVLVLTALAGLAASLFGDLGPGWVVGLLLGVEWVVVTAGYFVLFWSTAGQTPGMRLLRLRVRGPDGEPPGVARSLVRFVGLVLAIIPCFAGFLPVLFDDRRRGLNDLLAGTDVVSGDDPYSRAAVITATSAAGPSRTSPSQA